MKTKRVTLRAVLFSLACFFFLTARAATSEERRKRRLIEKGRRLEASPISRWLRMSRRSIARLSSAVVNLCLSRSPMRMAGEQAVDNPGLVREEQTKAQTDHAGGNP